MFRKSTIGLCLVSILAIAAILVGQLGAQSITGTISGTVTDPTGAVVPAAEVVLTNENTRATRSAVTTDAGEFVFTGLQPGSYAFKLEKVGFRGVNRKGTVLMAVVGAFYYLRIVKLMYFDAPLDKAAINAPADMKLVLSINALALLVLGLMPQSLMNISAVVTSLH